MKRAYRFGTSEHWRAAVFRGFAEAGDALVAQKPLAARKLDFNLDHILASPVGCGQVRLLDRQDGDVWTRFPGFLEADGKLGGVRQPFALVASSVRLWVGQKNTLLSYDATTLQLLGELVSPGLCSIATDRFDGLWSLSRHRDVNVVHHIDAWGRPRPRSFGIDITGSDGRIAVGPNGDWIVALTLADGCWTIFVVDLNCCKVESRFTVGSADPAKPPTVAIDESGSVLVLCPPDRLLRFNRNGTLAADDELGLLQSAQPVASLFDVDGELVVVGADGLYGVGPAPPNSEADRTAAIITPALVSPEGTPSGWNRAEVDIELPVGTSLQVSVVASSSPSLIGAAADLFASTTASPAERFNAISALLPWAQSADRVRTYFGTGGRARLHFLLDQLPQTHLWLRLEVRTSAGSKPPALYGISVYYPDQSWLDELPAIYRENEASAAQLHRFLAPLEILFDGLDARISRLPADIHPDTASAGRLDDLLSWLGFPSTAGLDESIQRDLLQHAGTLLVGRGTLGALRRLMEIITRGRAEVQDSATQGVLWMIGPSRTGRGARLGFDTRVVGSLPPAFRLGKTRTGSGVLGNEACIDIGALARDACATVRIRIAVEPHERAVLEPIVRALCGVFVPAHCRQDVRYLPAGALQPPQRLDDTAMLDGDAGDHLGRTSRAAKWRLTPGTESILSLDAHAELSGGRRIA